MGLPLVAPLVVYICTLNMSIDGQSEYYTTLIFSHGITDRFSISLPLGATAAATLAGAHRAAAESPSPAPPLPTLPLPWPTTTR